jgi:hypothetical protein
MRVPTFGTYPSDSLQPGLGPVDPTIHSASHSGPGPLADTMVRVPHGSWRDDAARVVRSSLMSTEVNLATSLYATWFVLTSQPIIPAACQRPSRLSVQTLHLDITFSVGTKTTISVACRRRKTYKATLAKKKKRV